MVKIMHTPIRPSQLFTLILGIMCAWFSPLRAQEQIEAEASAKKVHIFALMDPGDSAQQFEHFLSMPHVDGVAVRLGWNMLEPENDMYDWQRLDDALSVAHAHNKKITLHVAASPLGATPPWVLAQGAQSYEMRMPPGFMRKRATVEPMPWDPIYISSWVGFVQALAQHIQQSAYRDTLAYISSAVPVTEMSLIGCMNGDLSGLPYSRQEYLNAWYNAVNALGSAFTEIPILVSAPVPHICMPDNDGKAFFNDLLALQPTPNVMIFTADLNAEGSQRLNNLGEVVQNMPIGTQFIWSYSQDPSGRFRGGFAQAVCKGVENYHASYMEFYKDDLNNTDSAVAEVMQTLHETGQCR